VSSTRRFGRPARRRRWPTLLFPIIGVIIGFAATLALLST